MGYWDDLKAEHNFQSLLGPFLTIGIPTINRADLLTESLQDISNNLDTEDIHLILIDNGNQNIENIIPANLKDKTTIYIEPKNLGCCGSWNKIIKIAHFELNTNHLLILNDDVVLGKNMTDLKHTLNRHPKYDVLNSKYYWASFFISKKCIEKLGFFDEGFYPAYFDDTDYARRFHVYHHHTGDTIKYIEDGTLDPTIKRNSMTLKKGTINIQFGKSAGYYSQKWGGAKGRETYLYPFNDKQVQEPWKN